MRFVVGGGPSLRGFNFERLRGHQVVAVNAAYVDVPWASHVVFADLRFWEWQQRPELIEHWQGFKGVKLTTWQHRAFPADVTTWQSSKQVLSRTLGALSGANSGEKAVNLAFLLGGEGPIYLLGFDMKPNGNYHDRHVLANRQGHYECKFVPSMEKMGRELLQHVKVINACPDSGVTVFPRVSLHELPI